MKYKTLAIMSLIFLIILDSIVIADNIIPAYVRGREKETTYDFTFNFTSDSSCNNVLKSVETVIITDINGIGFASLDISDLTTPPSYMCEYQDGVLIAAHIWNDIITNKTTSNLFGDGTDYYIISQLALDTNASTECNDGYYLDGNGFCIHFNDSVKRLFSELQIIYNATSINTEVGTLDSGNLASIQNLADDDTYNVSEVSGVPGFLININFTNVTNFNTVALRGMYDGGGGDTLALEIYRIGVGWEERAEITDQVDWGVTTFPVFIGSNFINTTVGNGTVQLRINHDDTGKTAHNYFLDVVLIGQVPGLVSGGDLDDLTGRDEACSLLPDVFCKDGSKAMTGELDAPQGINTTNMSCEDGICEIYSTLDVTGYNIIMGNDQIQAGTGVIGSLIINLTGTLINKFRIIAAVHSTYMELNLGSTGAVWATNGLLNFIAGEDKEIRFYQGDTVRIIVETDGLTTIGNGTTGLEVDGDLNVTGNTYLNNTLNVVNGKVGINIIPASFYELQVVGNILASVSIASQKIFASANLVLPNSEGDDEQGSIYFDDDIYEYLYAYSDSSGVWRPFAPLRTKEITSSSDSFNVAGVSTLFINVGGGHMIIGGFDGGIEGQVLQAYLTDWTYNLIIEHNESSGTQKIIMHQGADQTLLSKAGGWTFGCDGTRWYEINNAEHYHP